MKKIIIKGWIGFMPKQLKAVKALLLRNYEENNNLPKKGDYLQGERRFFKVSKIPTFIDGTLTVLLT